MTLLTPGPCQTSETVRYAATGRDLNHREPEFLHLYADVRQRLLQVYSGLAAWRSHLIGGGGTAGMEALATSCIKAGPVLILENGYFSARMAEILETHRIPCERLSFDWTDSIDLDKVESELRKTSFEGVLLAHHETTSGRLNDLSQIGALAHRYGARVLVDAMSSFGADPIPCNDIDALCTTSNKCLHGVAGVAVVMTSPDTTEVMRSVQPRTYYLNLSAYECDDPRSTPPVPALMSLRQALVELGGAGAAERARVYAGRAAKIRAALVQAGLQLAISPAESSCAMSTASLPVGYSIDRWMEVNRDAGYMLYRCKGWMHEKYFQVANMGELSEAEIDGWIAVFKRLAAG